MSTLLLCRQALPKHTKTTLLDIAKTQKIATNAENEPKGKNTGQEIVLVSPSISTVRVS